MKLRILSALLALTMVLSLAGCDKPSPLKPIREEEKTESAPELVYTADSTTLDGDLLKDGIYPLLFTDEGFYGQVYQEMEAVPFETEEAAAEPEEKEESEPAEEKESSDESEPADEAESADESDETEQADEVESKKAASEVDYSIRLYFVSYDGDVHPLSAFALLPAPENTEDKLEYYSGSTVSGLLLDQEGGLVAVQCLYEGWFDGTEQELKQDTPESWEKYKSAQQFFLCRLNEDGSEKSRVKIDFASQDTGLNFNASTYIEDGALLVAGGDGLYVFAEDGSLAMQIPCDTISPDRLFRLRDGRLAVTGYTETGMALIPIDLEKKAVGEPIQIPSDAWDPLPGDEKYDIYYINGMVLYGYRLEDQQKDKVLNWLDVDVLGNSLDGFSIRKDGSLRCVLNQYRNERTKTELIHVYQVPYDSIPHKETLTMAVIYGYDLYDKVIDFNRHNDKVRIQIQDYSEYNDPENDDFEAGRTKLLTEILSGQVPDLIAVSQLPYRQLAAKGLLADLYPFLDADKELSREDFFPNVLRALEVKGGLYQVTSSFNVQTLVGPAKIVGDKPGWTYQQMKDALAKMDEDCELLDMYTTRGDLLRTLLCTDLDHYVDWSSGQCSFESQDFLDLLEFTAQFPAELPDDLEWESSADRIARGKQLLTTASLYSIDSMLWNDVQFGEEGCTYIGYPTSEGVGSYMTVNAGYAMSSACRDKEAAWEFLRSFITYDAQQSSWDGIPLSLKVYQEKLDKAMTPEYEKNEKGEYVLDKNGKRIQIPVGSIWMEDGSEKMVYNMTREQADKLWDAITSCEKIWEEDNALYSIVFEQAQAYYAGQKSAEDVARLIQSKALIYVNEQR